MTEADWQLFDARFADLFERLRAQDRRVEDLESRCTTLERRLRERDPEAEAYAERPVLRLAEPEPQPLCPRCEKRHSAELPCAPVDAAWTQFSDKGVTV